MFKFTTHVSGSELFMRASKLNDYKCSLLEFSTQGSLDMSAVFTRTLVYFNSYPLLRGVATYAVIWPVSNLCQQAIAGKEKFDFVEALRYTLYGAFCVAPSLHGWLKLSGAMWPQMNVKTALRKALVEQFSYAPFAVASFFFGMSLLEGKSSSESAHEVRTKFWPTLQVGVCVWPIIQTFNFAVVPEAYRVMFVGFCSLVWTCFLAYMKQLQTDKLQKLH